MRLYVLMISHKFDNKSNLIHNYDKIVKLLQNLGIEKEYFNQDIINQILVLVLGFYLLSILST